jgi:hypothetical protein
MNLVMSSSRSHPLRSLEQEKFDHTFDILVVTGSDKKAVEDALGTISEIDKVVVEVVDPDQAPAAAPAAAAEKAAAPARPRQLLNQQPRHRLRQLLNQLLRRKVIRASRYVLISISWIR